MNLVALKMLTGDKFKYISLVAGLAFAAFLIVQQASIFTGFSLQMGAWIRDTSVADLWVGITIVHYQLSTINYQLFQATV